MIEETAPAKVNLFLHVGPVRADGLHEIASLFVFADDGDRIRVERAPELSLRITGPFADRLAAFPVESNLVWRAAEALRSEAGVKEGAAIALDKRLPIAAGIGGGSSDAAAALRALRRLWRLSIDDEALARIGFRLGADVPACLAARPVYVSGAGEEIRSGPRLPPTWIVLANPGVETPTGPIFRAFDAENPSPRRPVLDARSVIRDQDELASYLAAARNDLEPLAVFRQSVIGAVGDFLAECPGCLLARMSGSGATVFGLFASADDAAGAARRAGERGWWSMAARLLADGA
jgi:4-diphosphocytidyl-2-C-methyl-D-erythritol kinase